MSTNISKYVQISDFLLLEYEFNRDGTTISLSNPLIATTNLGTTEYIDTTALGVTNNLGPLNSFPLNTQRTSWYNSSTGDYSSFFDPTLNPSLGTIYQQHLINMILLKYTWYQDIILMMLADFFYN